MLRVAESVVGLPYHWGGGAVGSWTRAGVDCSGLVCGLLPLFGLAPPSRLSSSALADWCAPLDEAAAVRPGALAYYPGHVIIYADGVWLSASGQRGERAGDLGGAVKAVSGPAYRRDLVTLMCPPGYGGEQHAAALARCASAGADVSAWLDRVLPTPRGWQWT